MIGDAPLLLLLIIEFIAVVFFALGYLIKYRKQTSLIAGFDRKTTADPDGLIAWIGNSLLALAVAAAAIFLLLLLLPEYALFIFFIYTAGIIPIAAIVVALRARTFDKKE
ncbi:DUF3784 domain-containing protein [Methanocalculus taiwanensis]|uniref:DUF3784 domain-containing protein n=1 Tax=Methanocalculus taiwanensis TaxID=106207 RepID=A0ABD4TI56_9EURY|nr:DUF3784 domain-containing protein [Methanocalculus taiwanensis]MCQ1537977.1 DUF3784 domain-containing protein [Methanocalculus taiwanensis]